MEPHPDPRLTGLILPPATTCTISPPAPLDGEPLVLSLIFHPHPHLILVAPVLYTLSLPSTFPASPPGVHCEDVEFVAAHGPAVKLNPNGGTTLPMLLGEAAPPPMPSTVFRTMSMPSLDGATFSGGTNFTSAFSWSFLRPTLADVVWALRQTLVAGGRPQVCVLPPLYLPFPGEGVSPASAGTVPSPGSLAGEGLSAEAEAPAPTVVCSHGRAELKGRRDAMEDRAMCVDAVRLSDGRDASVYALFDGHGGVGAAEFAAERMLPAFLSRVEGRFSAPARSGHAEPHSGAPSPTASPSSAALALYDAFLDVDRELQARVQGAARSGGASGPPTKPDDGSAAWAGVRSGRGLLLPAEILGTAVAASTASTTPTPLLPTRPRARSPVLSSRPSLVIDSGMGGAGEDEDADGEGCAPSHTTTSSPGGRGAIGMPIEGEVAPEPTGRSRAWASSRRGRLHENSVRHSGATALVLVAMRPPRGEGAPLQGCVYLSVACAGDSRAVLVHGGRAVPLSVDHKPDRLDERARVLTAGGMILNRRVMGGIAVTRSIGDVTVKHGMGGAFLVSPEPDVVELQLLPSTLSSSAPPSFVIMACDGVWDVLTENDAGAMVADALSMGCDATSAARILVQAAFDKGSKDNISAVIVKLGVGSLEEVVGAAPPSTESAMPSGVVAQRSSSAPVAPGAPPPATTLTPTTSFTLGIHRTRTSERLVVMSSGVGGGGGSGSGSAAGSPLGSPQLIPHLGSGLSALSTLTLGDGDPNHSNRGVPPRPLRIPSSGSHHTSVRSTFLSVGAPTLLALESRERALASVGEARSRSSSAGERGSGGGGGVDHPPPSLMIRHPPSRPPSTRGYAGALTPTSVMYSTPASTPSSVFSGHGHHSGLLKGDSMTSTTTRGSGDAVLLRDDSTLSEDDLSATPMRLL